MSQQLPHVKVDREVYERPSQKWVCGWAREGRPCHLGPTPRGQCVITTECTPRRKGGGWVCSRTKELGGACEQGPLPDGGCSVSILPCQPVRSFRAQRSALVFWTLGLTLGALLLAYAGPWRESFISAGELGFQHRTIVDGCAGCHVGMDQDGATTGESAAPSMNDNCLGCHDLGEHSLRIHSVAPARIADLSEKAQGATDLAEPPFLLALAKLLPGARAYTEGTLHCASCHSEHRGKDFDARQLDDMQCQACHTVQFSSFADGHPDFTSYPYERRTRLIFDHARHEGVHYDQTDKAFQCSDCHQPDAAGRQMTLKSFQSACLDCHGESKTTSPSKVYHHGDQIAGGGYNIIFFTLPRIDLETLEKKKIDIGFWPEGTRKASRDGLTRLGITPFTELLISADPTVAEALARLNEKNVQLRSLRKAKKQDLADVAEVIWAIKELLVELEAVDEGTVLPMRRRLDLILKRSLGTREVAALNGQIPRLMFRSALTAWFPWPEDGKQADLYKEVERYRKARCASDPGRCLQRRSDNEEEQEGEAVGVQWVTTGDWGRNQYSLQYRISGHADDFLRAWLDLGFELSQSPMTINEAGKAIYEELADSSAEPGESKGPGRCMKCHSIEIGGPLVRINWKPFQPQTDLHTFTVFRHEPHLQLGDQQACIVCHDMEGSEKSDIAKTAVLASYASAKVTDFTGNFTPMTKKTCVDCHTADAAGKTCLSCHNYHVGTCTATRVRSTAARGGGAAAEPR